MKTLKLIALAAFALLFSQCKSATDTNLTNRPLSEVAQILRATEDKFLSLYSLTNLQPKIAIEQTKDWLMTQPNVASAETFDSIYIDITLKSGLQTMYYYNEVTPNGYSVFRGGGSTEGVRLETFGKQSKNLIKNKNALIYAAAYSEFYKTGEMDKITSLLGSSGIVSTTLKTDDHCGYKMIESFKDYGLVIIDTHGARDGFWVGTKIDTSEADNEDILKKNIISVAGEVAYARIQSNELRLVKQINWINTLINGKETAVPMPYYQLWVTTNYLQSLPKMSGTVIFGNMCYSGNDRVSATSNLPIRTAFLNKEPISYYCYTFDNNSSTSVTDIFSKEMEDSLIRALVVDGDSTGIAHLRQSGEFFYDELLIAQGLTQKQLKFKHYGADDYSYFNCIDTFTDDRDGQIYKAVCIGDQIWMAQNLNYNAPGSLCYDDLSVNCDTYGRLYDWATVMKGAGSSSSTPSGVQGICPKGWHIPSSNEITKLIEAAGGDAAAPGNLKSTSSLWKSPNTDATNSSGFSALPGGMVSETLSIRQGEYAFFWSTTMDTDTTSPPLSWIFGLFLQNTKQTSPNAEGYKITSNPCRCLKDK